MKKLKVAQSNENFGLALSSAKPIQESKSTVGVHISLVWGAGIKEVSDNHKGPPVVPNPWPPSDIITLLTFAFVVGRAARPAIELITAWLDYRKVQKTIIRNGDVEIEIHGGVSEKKLEKYINQYQRLSKDLNPDDVEIILPSRTNRKIPLALTYKERSSKEPLSKPPKSKVEKAKTSKKGRKK